MIYTEALSRELRAVGIRGRRRTRILTEIADHMACDADAELGEPDQLARQFADELGTSLARRAALGVFAGLAVAGVLFSVAFLAHPGVLRSATDTARPFSNLAAVLMVVGPQLAFVAGVLAALRVVRGKTPVVARAEATVIVRRAATGWLAGLASMAGFAWIAVILGDRAPGWWVALTLGLSGAGVLALVASAPLLLAAARLRPVAAGSAGDMFDDFGPLVPRRLGGKPWWLALVVAGAVAAAIAVAGVVQSDPFDGVLRGVADGLACLLGFAVLGRYLGLRS